LSRDFLRRGISDIVFYEVYFLFAKVYLPDDFALDGPDGLHLVLVNIEDGLGHAGQGLCHGKLVVVEAVVALLRLLILLLQARVLQRQV
jgi:hypothetical protein